LQDLLAERSDLVAATPEVTYTYEGRTRIIDPIVCISRGVWRSSAKTTNLALQNIVLLVVKIVKSISIVVAPLVERLIIFAVLLVKAVVLCR